jgi:glucose-6-phosphate isomerase
MNTGGSVFPQTTILDWSSGAMLPSGEILVQHLSGMFEAYADSEAVANLLQSGEDPVIYHAWTAGAPGETDHLVYRTTVRLPGELGGEYFMTRGHHHVKDSAEFYLGMSGTGLVLMQTRDGELRVEKLEDKVAVYVPPGWAHRSVNTGLQELVFLAVYFGDAGHDYGSMAQSGFVARVFARPTGPEVRVTEQPS